MSFITNSLVNENKNINNKEVNLKNEKGFLLTLMPAKMWQTVGSYLDKGQTLTISKPIQQISLNDEKNLLLSLLPSDLWNIIESYEDPKKMGIISNASSIQEIALRQEKTLAKKYASAFGKLVDYLEDDLIKANKTIRKWIKELEKEVLQPEIDTTLSHKDIKSNEFHQLAKKVKNSLVQLKKKAIARKILQKITKNKTFPSTDTTIDNKLVELAKKDAQQKISIKNPQILASADLKKIEKEAHEEIYKKERIENLFIECFDEKYLDLTKRLRMLGEKSRSTNSSNEPFTAKIDSLLNIPIKEFNPFLFLFKLMSEITSKEDHTTTIDKLETYLRKNNLSKNIHATLGVIYCLDCLFDITHLQEFLPNDFLQENRLFLVDKERLGSFLQNLFFTNSLNKFWQIRPKAAALLVNTLSKQPNYRNIIPRRIGAALKYAISPKLSEVQTILMSHPNFYKKEVFSLNFHHQTIQSGNKRVLSQVAYHPYLSTITETDQLSLLGAFCENDGTDPEVNKWFIKLVPSYEIELGPLQFPILLQSIAHSGNLFMLLKIKEHPDFKDFLLMEQYPEMIFNIIYLVFDSYKNYRDRAAAVVRNFLSLLPLNKCDKELFSEQFFSFFEEESYEEPITVEILTYLFSHPDKMTDELESYAREIAEEIDFDLAPFTDEEKKS